MLKGNINIIELHILLWTYFSLTYGLGKLVKLKALERTNIQKKTTLENSLEPNSKLKEKRAELFKINI